MSILVWFKWRSSAAWACLKPFDWFWGKKNTQNFAFPQGHFLKAGVLPMIIITHYEILLTIIIIHYEILLTIIINHHYSPLLTIIIIHYEILLTIIINHHYSPLLTIIISIMKYY